MAPKIYFLTSEITPFSETGKLAHFSKYVPIRFLEHGSDIRLTSPKYGFISERKYILREVIRLREISCDFNGSVVKASAKSAFIPHTKVQVYFVEHPEWFQPLSPLLYKSRNGRPLGDNNQRFGIFCKITLLMLTNLFWKPDVIICNDWQSAYVSILYKTLFKKEGFYKDIKVIQLIHNMDSNSKISTDIFSSLGAESSEPLLFDHSEVNIYQLSRQFADLTVVCDDPNSSVTNQLTKAVKGNKKGEAMLKNLKTLVVENESQESYTKIADNLYKIVNSLNA